MESPSFIAGRFDNAFLESFSIAAPDETGDRARLAAIAAAAVAYQHQREEANKVAGDKRAAESAWKVAARRSAVGL
jgi:hypothetical protein